MVVVRGLNMFPTMVAAVIGGFAELTSDYRIVLDGLPPYDALPIEVELVKTAAASPALAERIEQKFKRNLGATTRITLRPHGCFPATEGKTKRVIRKNQ